MSESDDVVKVFECKDCGHESREDPMNVEPIGTVVEAHATCPYCGTAEHRIEWVER